MRCCTQYKQIQWHPTQLFTYNTTLLQWDSWSLVTEGTGEKTSTYQILPKKTWEDVLSTCRQTNSPSWTASRWKRAPISQFQRTTCPIVAMSVCHEIWVFLGQPSGKVSLPFQQEGRATHKTIDTFWKHGQRETSSKRTLIVRKWTVRQKRGENPKGACLGGCVLAYTCVLNATGREKTLRTKECTFGHIEHEKKAIYAHTHYILQVAWKMIDNGARAT